VEVRRGFNAGNRYGRRIKIAIGKKPRNINRDFAFEQFVNPDDA
jgi:hypothetical protein